MKNTKKIMLISSTAALFLGALAGMLYMAFSGTDDGLYSYLSQFLTGFPAAENRCSVFKHSLADTFKIAAVLTACGFFKFGIIGTLACCAIKGFVSGFTTAAFVRYYSLRGLLVPLSSLMSTILFIPVFILFSACSASFSLKKNEKNSVGSYLLLSLIFLTIFCVISFMDGYVTTTFMKLLKPFIVNNQQF